MTLDEYINTLPKKTKMAVTLMSKICTKVSIRKGLFHTKWVFTTRLDDKGTLEFSLNQGSLTAINIIAAAVSNHWPQFYVAQKDLEDRCLNALHEIANRK